MPFKVNPVSYLLRQADMLMFTRLIFITVLLHETNQGFESEVKHPTHLSTASLALCSFYEQVTILSVENI